MNCDSLETVADCVTYVSQAIRHSQFEHTLYCKMGEINIGLVDLDKCFEVAKDVARIAGRVSVLHNASYNSELENGVNICILAT